VEVECVLAELRDAGAHVVRYGHLPERLVTTAVGDVSVSVPRIRSRDGVNVNLASTMVPRCLRRSAFIDAWACYAYLRGVSEADIAGVLEVVLGEGAKKVTPAVLLGLKKAWTSQFDEWKTRDLSATTFAYLYADGIYQNLRGDHDKICVLVLMGVDSDGHKHLISLDDGVRESTQRHGSLATRCHRSLGFERVQSVDLSVS